MALEERIFQTREGAARAVFRDDVLCEIFLPGLGIEGLEDERRLFGLEQIPGNMVDVVEQAAATLVARSDRLEVAHLGARTIISPPHADPPLVLPGRFELSRDWEDGPATSVETDFRSLLYYSFGSTRLIFEVAEDGAVVPRFTPEELDAVRLSARLDAIWETLPEVSHPVFGQFKPDRLVAVAPIRLGRFGAQIAVDVWMPERAIEGFDPSVLDVFVPLVKQLKAAAPEVASTMADLRDDWVEDWVHPSNASVAGAFHAAFPGVQSAVDLSADMFIKALRLKRLMLSPFEESGPTISWDFHVLAPEDDRTVFVARTDATGRVLEVTTEC